MKELKTTLLLSVIVGLSGCAFDIDNQPEAAECYYRNPNKRISSMGRVAIVELSNETGYPAVSADVSETLYNQLQKKQVVGLFVVHRSDPLWKALELPPLPPYDLQRLADIRSSLKCDALLVGTVTEYKPYPHLTVGLRLKMIDLSDGQLVWGYEQIWDTADKNCEQMAEKYYRTQKNTDFSLLRKKLISASSIEFLKFVSFEVSQTL
jgi:hypothetical protein